MSLFRTNIKSLIKINTIVFDNFVNLKAGIEIPPTNYAFIDESLNKSNIFTNIIGKNEKNENQYKIKFEDLEKLKLNQPINSVIKYNMDKYKYLHKDILAKASNELKEKIYKYTYFEYGFEYWILTDLVRRYNIQGKELFLAMTANNEKYQKIWDEANESSNGYKYFDYIGGYGIKNGYLTDVYKGETMLNLRKYVDRSGIAGYTRLIDLMEEKIKIKATNNYIETIGKNTEKNTEKIKIKDIDESWSDNENKITIPSMNLEGKTVNYCNHNLNTNKTYSFGLNLTNEEISILNKDLDEDTDDDYEIKYKKSLERDKRDLAQFKKFISNGISNGDFDLEKYFEYKLRPKYDWTWTDDVDKTNLDNYILVPKKDYEKSFMEDLSVTNCIIFGKSNIRFCDVEKLLSLIRYKYEMYVETLDNFEIYYSNTHFIKPNTIDEKINSMEFCKYQDMLECAKWLIQIMNEIEPSLINLHNYHTLVNYCKQKDNLEEKEFNILIRNEKYRIEKKTFN